MTKSAKPEKPPSAKKVSEEDVLVIMEKLAVNGVSEVGSRLISDKLDLEPDKGRSVVRRIMKRLEKVGKVEARQKEVGKRKQYIYKLKESK